MLGTSPFSAKSMEHPGGATSRFAGAATVRVAPVPVDVGRRNRWRVSTECVTEESRTRLTVPYSPCQPGLSA